LADLMALFIVAGIVSGRNDTRRVGDTEDRKQRGRKRAEALNAWAAGLQSGATIGLRRLVDALHGVMGGHNFPRGL
jgi:hypothetical protein